MSAVPVAQTMTAEEFLALPVPEHGRPWNLVDGEVVVSQPTGRHGITQGYLYFALESWRRASANSRGAVALPCDVQLDPLNVFAPDLLWYPQGRAPALLDPPPYPVPDLAVEVRSPSTWRYDIGAKKAAYEGHGLLELWLVDTSAEVLLVFRRSGPKAQGFDVSLELERQDTLDSPLLPGFALPLAEVFPAE